MVEEKQEAIQEETNAQAELSNVSARLISSEELFNEAEVLLITHGNKVYQLRRTNNGGLILTK